MWHGLAPNVMANEKSGNISTRHDFATWLDYGITYANSSAQFSIQGRNSKQCRLLVDNPVSTILIEDAASNPRYNSVAKGGSSQVHLFSRDWDKNFQGQCDVGGARGEGSDRQGDVRVERCESARYDTGI